ncbi:MAG: hypothetical protein HYZ53_29150 [Planctomycetes bacterium]|nr:hypothetical protein [Planctomycetota bacterium]
MVSFCTGHELAVFSRANSVGHRRDRQDVGEDARAAVRHGADSIVEAYRTVGCVSGGISVLLQ